MNMLTTRWLTTTKVGVTGFCRNRTDIPLLIHWLCVLHHYALSATVMRYIIMSSFHSLTEWDTKWANKSKHDWGTALHDKDTDTEEQTGYRVHIAKARIIQPPSYIPIYLYLPSLGIQDITLRMLFLVQIRHNWYRNAIIVSSKYEIASNLNKIASNF